MLFPEHLRFEGKNVGSWGHRSLQGKLRVPLSLPLEGKMFVLLELLLKGTAFVHSPMATSRENCILNGHYKIQPQGNYVCSLGIPTRRKNFHQKGKIVIPLDMPLEGKHFLFPMGTATRRETFQFPGNCHQKGKMFVSLKLPPACKNVCSLGIPTRMEKDSSLEVHTRRERRQFLWNPTGRENFSSLGNST